MPDKTILLYTLFTKRVLVGGVFVGFGQGITKQRVNEKKQITSEII